MCCQKINANLPIYNSTIDFTIDQILFGKPVFRHVNYHDIFLYQSKNTTEWIIGKGLLQNSILYFGKSKSGLAQAGFRIEVQRCHLLIDDTVIYSASFLKPSPELSNE